MAEYIEREALLDSICHETCGIAFCGAANCAFMAKVCSAPAADVSPVRHGRWENRQGGFWGVATCSVCGKKSHIGKVSPPYCPNCGAKMDWEDGDEMASTDSMEKTEIAPARISDSAKIALCKELIGDFYTCANCESIDAVNMLLANLLTTLEFGEEKPVLMQTEDGEKWSS